MIKPGSSSLHFAACFALVGLAVGGYVSWSAIGDGWEFFFVYSSTAAFVTGFGLWRWRVERRQTAGCRAGLFTGALAGLLSHLLCWWLFILGAWLDHSWLTSGASQGEPPMNPLQGIIGAIVFSLFSLALFGWLTIPAGALIGCWMLRTAGSRSGIVSEPDVRQ
ncbi:hypothetical protein [Halochromatium sp.]